MFHLLSLQLRLGHDNNKQQLNNIEQQKDNKNNSFIQLYKQRCSCCPFFVIISIAPFQRTIHKQVVSVCLVLLSQHLHNNNQLIREGFHTSSFYEQAASH